MIKITSSDVLRALQRHRLSTTAACVAQLLGTTSRAVATAARPLVDAGQVTMRFTKRSRGAALYRFVRLSPRKAGGASA